MKQHIGQMSGYFKGRGMVFPEYGNAAVLQLYSKNNHIKRNLETYLADEGHNTIVLQNTWCLDCQWQWELFALEVNQLLEFNMVSFWTTVSYTVGDECYIWLGTKTVMKSSSRTSDMQGSQWTIPTISHCIFLMNYVKHICWSFKSAQLPTAEFWHCQSILAYAWCKKISLLQKKVFYTFLTLLG